MDEADEFELRRDQLETLKALRAPIAAASAGQLHLVIDDLIALGLVPPI